MSHTEALTRYTAHFVDELAQSGLTNVVISPGSRSTPLAMMMCEHEDIQEWITIDERSAAYFALGMAKNTRMPVALICTSGTAAANYFPAIIEAKYNLVPLIILTADRPHELRDVGAPQAIDQLKIYGDHVKWFQEMPLPESSQETLSFVRTAANRAIQIARAGNPGPVHLNFPFREPLIPNLELDNLWGSDQKESYHKVFDSIKKVTKSEIQLLLHQLTNKRKGIIVCGPQEDKELPKFITMLAGKWGIPVLADPLSQLRAGEHGKEYIIENYDAMFRNEQIRRQLKPDFIIRFGSMPISKFYSFFINEHRDALHFIVEPYEGFQHPTKQPANFIYADPIQFSKDLLKTANQTSFSKVWLEKWLNINKIATNHIQSCQSKQITEGSTVRSLLEVIPHQSTLYVGNSMPVRDLDTFFMSMDKELFVLGNRGASGIEGLVSSALGVSATSKERVTLLIGDLSFYHDLNGLLIAKQYNLNLTIVLINNNGGGIFSFLPQANDKEYFERLFGTPLNIDFKHVVQMYGGTYEIAENLNDLKRKLDASYQIQGLTVVEVRTEREKNKEWHQNLWKQIEQDILIGEW